MSEEIKKVNENSNIETHEEQMLERWTYKANGYTFIVRPIMLGEEKYFLDDLKASPVPAQMIENDGVMPTDKELSRWAITLFSDALNEQFRKEEKEDGKKISILQRFKKFFYIKIIHKKNYTYYEEFPAVQPIVKWLEQKVTYKGEPILFYELERKYQLNKAEIEKLFIFLYQISGF